MYTLDTTAISTPSELVLNTHIKKPNEVYIASQTFQTYPLINVAIAHVKPEADSTTALGCIFANQSDTDIAIQYLDFDSGNNTWNYAFVRAGESMPHLVRAVKTDNGSNFLKGHYLRY